MDTTSGVRTVLTTISYPSYSSNRAGGTLLVAETHEPGAIPDPQIHLYGSSDGGATWGVLYAFTIPSTQGYTEMYVDSVFPNGDVAVQVEGQGTVVLRLSGGSGGGGSVPGSLVAAGDLGLSRRQGQVLSASAGSWSGNPTSFSYQWRRCATTGSSCSTIAGAAASTYLVQAADVGSTLRVRVTASNVAGASAPADSNATATVTSAGGTTSLGPTSSGVSSAAPGAGYKFGSPYVLGVAGTVTQFQFFAAGGSAGQSFTPAIYSSAGSAPGSLLVTGATVTVAAGQAAGWVSSALPPTALAAGTYYLVLVSGTASSAASVFYDPGNASDGVFNPNPAGVPTSTFGAAGTEPRRWSFRATGSAGGGGGGGGQPPVNTSPPAISGTAQQGQTLGATPGVWNGNPSSFAYQWRRCNTAGSSCNDIVSAVAVTYVVQAADVGFTLRVRVTASNGAGAGAPADSSATATCTASSGGGGGSVTLGAATAGVSSAAPGAGYKFGSPYVLGVAGTVTQFQFFAAGGAAGQSFTPAIYSSAGSAPGSLLVTGATVTVAAGQAAGWVSSALPPTALAAGTYYLVLVSGTASSAASVFYDPGNASDGVFNPNPAGVPTSTFGAAGTEPRRWSFRAA